MQDKWEHAVQLIGKRPVCVCEIAPVLDGERTVKASSTE
jgi:hypothetical protein